MGSCFVQSTANKPYLINRASGSFDTVHRSFYENDKHPIMITKSCFVRKSTGNILNEYKFLGTLGKGKYFLLIVKVDMEW